ncbi:disulfide bond formation protein DsbB [Thalassotalea sediminis]|uniref:disulfide bond formation protein DsbB n=1 Tax=Thalassotalea sediminis TaxID=1759089 RepID=UPI0025723BD9|nr:disulfide bond formation protein DsbB [Thalassotalea sediminis]
MNFLSHLTTNKNAWLLLFITALALEFSALYFQYMMGLKPCVMCIYQRTAMWSIVLAGVIGYFGCSSVFGRIIAYGLWATGAIWGLLIAMEHVEMQNATMSFLFGCEFVPNFPTWAPLHEWIPTLFKADGSCNDIDWQFLGHSMPQWMVVIFSIYTAAFAAILLSRLKQTKMF